MRSTLVALAVACMLVFACGPSRETYRFVGGFGVPASDCDAPDAGTDGFTTDFDMVESFDGHSHVVSTDAFPCAPIVADGTLESAAIRPRDCGVITMDRPPPSASGSVVPKANALPTRLMGGTVSMSTKSDNTVWLKLSLDFERTTPSGTCELHAGAGGWGDW